MNSDNDYINFKLKYKGVLQKSDQALMSETAGNLTEAFSIYKSVICELDNLLSSDLSYSNSDTDVINKIKEMKSNLQKLRDNMCDRVDYIRRIENQDHDLPTASLIYSVPEGCQYCRIRSDGIIDPPSYPGCLEIYKFPGSTNEKGFIVVGDWMNPLVRQVTPVFLSVNGSIVFVDDNCPDSRIFVTLPYDISAEEFQRFLSILSTLSMIVYDDGASQSSLCSPSDSEGETDVGKTTGEVIAQNVGKVARSLSQGVVTGATKLGDLVIRGSDELCKHIKPCDEKSAVNPNVKLGVEYARKGTHGLVEIGEKAFSVLMTASRYVATKATPHIKAAGNSIIPDDWKEKGLNGELSKAEQIGCVASASFLGVSTVLEGLEQAAIIFGRSVTRGSSSVMTHRYGEEYGKTTENALYSAGNIGMIAILAGRFTKKGLIKTAAKVTAIELAATSKGRKPDLSLNAEIHDSQSKSID